MFRNRRQHSTMSFSCHVFPDTLHLHYDNRGCKPGGQISQGSQPDWEYISKSSLADIFYKVEYQWWSDQPRQGMDQKENSGRDRHCG